jgi:sugar transferase (PEP-CTERM system associated)
MLRVFKQYYPIRNLFFIIGEALFMYASVLMAAWIILSPDGFMFDGWLFFKILLITIVCQTCLYYNDLYNFNVVRSFSEMGIRLMKAIAFAAILLALVYIIFPYLIISASIIILCVCFLLSLIVSWRCCYLLILNQGLFNQKIVLVGSGELTRKIKKEINERKDCGYVIAFEIPEATDDAEYGNEITTAWCCKTNPHSLCELAQDLSIKKIVVSLKEKRQKFPAKELLKCRMEGIDIIDGNSFYEMLTGKLIVSAINPSWFIFSDGFHKSTSRRILKRTIDLLFSFAMLILFLPIIAVIAVLIKVDSKGPIFYSQERVGARGKTFRMLKFRSMICNAEQECGPVWTQNDDQRITKVGRIIRKLRFDEIPQLLNVLKGEMSFVGPRPEREYFVEQLKTIVPYYNERLTVKPGISGWAQVCYGYGASVEDAIEKLNYDLFYIKNFSVYLDLMIVLKTVKIVLFGNGAR